jgi:hypothetical protein
MVVKVIMGEPEQLQLEVEGPSLERGAAAAGLQRRSSRRPHSRNRSMASYSCRPMETAIRLAYRLFHQFIRQRDI